MHWLNHECELGFLYSHRFNTTIFILYQSIHTKQTMQMLLVIYWITPVQLHQFVPGSVLYHEWREFLFRERFNSRQRCGYGRKLRMLRKFQLFFRLLKPMIDTDAIFMPHRKFQSITYSILFPFSCETMFAPLKRQSVLSAPAGVSYCWWNNKYTIHII